MRDPRRNEPLVLTKCGHSEHAGPGRASRVARACFDGISLGQKAGVRAGSDQRSVRFGLMVASVLNEPGWAGAAPAQWRFGAQEARRAPPCRGRRIPRQGEDTRRPAGPVLSRDGDRRASPRPAGARLLPRRPERPGDRVALEHAADLRVCGAVERAFDRVTAGAGPERAGFGHAEAVPAQIVARRVRLDVDDFGDPSVVIGGRPRRAGVAEQSR